MATLNVQTIQKKKEKESNEEWSNMFDNDSCLRDINIKLCQRLTCSLAWNSKGDLVDNKITLK